LNTIEAMAELQYGLITRAQALTLGVSDSAISRRVRAGRWVPVHVGVFRIAGAPVTRSQRMLAATLWTSGLVSHASGCELLRLGRLRTDELELTVPYQSNIRTDAFIVHRSKMLPDIDRRCVDNIPCTSATRTLIDSAPHLDDEEFESAFETARRMGLTTITLMERRAVELCGRGRPGSDRVRRVLAAATSRPLESRLEVKTARLIRRSGLPDPVRQFVLGKYRLDFAWPPRRFALECDGFEHHGARLAWKRDRRRVAAIEAMRWRTMHVTWDDVTERPAETIDRIAYALRACA